jgi:putative transposase
VWSRGVVGWAMRPDARAELVVDALEMALWRRKPAPGVGHHSDRGAQYTSLRFGARLRAARILPSRGRKGDAYDNALREAFFAPLEREVLDRHRFHTREEARSVLFSYLEVVYNRRPRHSALGYLSPEEFERRWWTGHESLSATLSTKGG